MRILGVDPGSISGAVAMISEYGVRIADIPVIGKNVNAAELARMLKEWSPDFACVESVSAYPGQGISSSFQFGRGYGTAIGVLGALEIPTHFVTPVTWKRHFNLAGKRDDKDAGRTLAIQLFPAVRGLELKKHGNRADALLLAKWLIDTKH